MGFAKSLTSHATDPKVCRMGLLPKRLPQNTSMPKTRPTYIQQESAGWNTFHLVELAEAHALAQVARDEVQTRLIAEQMDTNKLLRDQNRMIWDLLQAQSPESSAIASM